MLSTTGLARKVSALTGRVMVSIPHRPMKQRHLKCYFDAEGPYVRTGKRGQCKERLTAYRICCRDPLVVVFQSSWETQL